MLQNRSFSQEHTFDEYATQNADDTAPLISLLRDG